MEQWEDSAAVEALLTVARDTVPGDTVPGDTAVADTAGDTADNGR